MKSKDDFIEYYKKFFHQMVKDDYKLYHNIYINKKNKIVLEQCILFLLTVACFILWIKKIFDENILTLTLVFFSALFVGLLIVNIRLLKKNKEICMSLVNDSIYRKLLSFLSNDNYVYEGNTQLSYEDFMKMELFNLNILNYTGSNLTASNTDGKLFVCCDATLYDLKPRMKVDRHYDSKEDIEYIYQYHYREQVNIFKGLYYETTIKRKNNQYIYLIPNNISDLFIRKNIKYYINFDGERVELENLDFEKRYNVYSVDEIKSRYILSITLMEKINELDRRIPNKKYLVFKGDGRLGIFIDGFTIDDIKNKKFNFKHEPSLEYLIKFFMRVRDIFYICTIFDEE